MKNKKREKRHSRWRLLCIILLAGLGLGTLQGVVTANTQHVSLTRPAIVDTKKGESSKDSSLMGLTFPGMLYNTDSKLVQLATAYTTSPVDTPSEQQKQHGKSAVEKHSLKRLQILLIVALLLTLGGFFVSSLIPQMAGVNVKSSRSRKLASQKAGARITSSRTRKPVFSTGKNGSRVRTTNRPKKVVHQMAGVGTGAVASRTSGVAPRMYETSIGSLTDLTSAYAAPSKVTATKKAPKLQVASDNILQDIPDKILLDAHDPERKNATLSSLPDASPTLLRMAKSFFHQSDFEYTSRSGAHGVLRATIAQYKRYGDIPVFFLKKTGFNETLLQEISNSLSNRGHKSHGKIAFMIVDEPLHASHYRQLYAVKSEHHITIIPISCDIIARSVKNSTCAQTMENLLSSMLTPKNLYESNRPINNPLEFFGRDELLHSLLDSAGHLQHIGLFGLRGIGKTSLVWQLREHLSRDVVAYIDLQHIPHDCSYLYQSILQECLKDASFKYPDVKLPKCDCADGMPEEKQGVIFLQTLVKLWEALKVGRHDMKIVLLLDEAESFVPGTTEHETGFAGFHEFMGIIRGISEQYGFLVSVVVSSRPEISRLDTWNGQSNPGFQFYKEVFLSSLPETGCNQMISSLGAQMGLTFTEEALSRIYYETGGHPYVTRQLCGLITEKSKERHDNDSWQTASERVPGTIQVQEVEDAISEYIEHKSDYLDSVWQRLSSIEQEILLTILTNHSCALKDLITPTQNYDAKRQHRKAISTLIENEIIEKCENKYSLRMGLFERFLLSSN